MSVRRDKERKDRNTTAAVYQVDHPVGRPQRCDTTVVEIQSNFNVSNTDGSFTMAFSNSFLSPYGIFPIAQENKY